MDKIIFSFAALNFVVSSLNSIIVPFFPLMIYQKKVNQGIIGLIFATAPLGTIFYYFTFGLVIPKKNTSILFIITIFFKFFALILMGSVIFFDNYNIILIVSFASQFFKWNW